MKRPTDRRTVLIAAGAAALATAAGTGAAQSSDIRGAVKFAGGVAPTLSTGANAIDRLVATYNATDDILMCSIDKGFA